MSEKAPLQDSLRKRRGRPAIEKMRIEISFRRNRQKLSATAKRSQLDNDTLELWQRISVLRNFRKIFAAANRILRIVLLRRLMTFRTMAI